MSPLWWQLVVPKAVTFGATIHSHWAEIGDELYLLDERALAASQRIPRIFFLTSQDLFQDPLEPSPHQESSRFVDICWSAENWTVEIENLKTLIWKIDNSNLKIERWKF